MRLTGINSTGLVGHSLLIGISLPFLLLVSFSNAIGHFRWQIPLGSAVKLLNELERGLETIVEANIVQSAGEEVAKGQKCQEEREKEGIGCQLLGEVVKQFTVHGKEEEGEKAAAPPGWALFSLRAGRVVLSEKAKQMFQEEPQMKRLLKRITEDTNAMAEQGKDEQKQREALKRLYGVAGEIIGKMRQRKVGKVSERQYKGIAEALEGIRKGLGRTEEKEREKEKEIGEMEKEYEIGLETRGEGGGQTETEQSDGGGVLGQWLNGKMTTLVQIILEKQRKLAPEELKARIMDYMIGGRGKEGEIKGILDQLERLVQAKLEKIKGKKDNLRPFQLQLLTSIENLTKMTRQMQSLAEAEAKGDEMAKMLSNIAEEFPRVLNLLGKAAEKGSVNNVAHKNGHHLIRQKRDKGQQREYEGEEDEDQNREDEQQQWEWDDVQRDFQGRRVNNQNDLAHVRANGVNIQIQEQNVQQLLHEINREIANLTARFERRMLFRRPIVFRLFQLIFIVIFLFLYLKIFSLLMSGEPLVLNLTLLTVHLPAVLLFYFLIGQHFLRNALILFLFILSLLEEMYGEDGEQPDWNLD